MSPLKKLTEDFWIF